MIPPSDRIIVALDTPEVSQAVGWVRQLGGAVGAFKLGLEFLHGAGPDGVRAVQEAGAGRIFLDTKFADIPNTVRGAVRASCALGPWLLNVHAMAGEASLRAAKEAAAAAAATGGRNRALVIAVTILTSLDTPALHRIGVEGEVQDQVVRLAVLARDCGLDGVVASPLEVEEIRAACGPGFLIVTPGVRPSGGESHDQARVATPGAAVRSGADYVVVGRAITAAPDPAAAAAAIAEDIAGAPAASR